MLGLGVEGTMELTADATVKSMTRRKFLWEMNHELR